MPAREVAVLVGGDRDVPSIRRHIDGCHLLALQDAAEHPAPRAHHAAVQTLDVRGERLMQLRHEARYDAFDGPEVFGMQIDLVYRRAQGAVGELVQVQPQFLSYRHPDVPPARCLRVLRHTLQSAPRHYGAEPLSRTVRKP